jgi:tight adherence protein C
MDSTTLFALSAVMVLITGGLYFLVPSKAGKDTNRAASVPTDGIERQSLKDLRKQPGPKQESAQLRKRLIHAGFYGKNALLWMSIAKVLSLCIPLSVAMLVTYLTSMSIQRTASIALGLGIAGMIGPSFVLDRIKRQRQLRIRRAIPDALDVLSICLEAGMSLPAALSKVSQELAGAHPGLATELAIVNRETLLGRSVGESMRALADRFDIEELRSMSSVMVQAEKYGSSLVDAMEVFAATMRQKRMFAAEANAQQSVVKILIPTVLCILPALFLVTLGPAVIMIMRGLAKT